MMTLSGETPMPRTIDYSMRPTPELYERYGQFVPFRNAAGDPEPRFGRNEISLKELWGGDPLGFLQGPQFQYSLHPPKGVNPYANSMVDPIHAWLGDNCRGRYCLFEHVVNHGHSVDTEVFIESEDDQRAFEARWSTLARRDERAFEHNAGLKATTPSP